MDDYKKFEAQCKAIRKENEGYLEAFELILAGHNYADKTIQRHINNVALYINDFLLRYEPNHIKEGITKLDDFLGNYFIRKCMWSTPATIKTTAASIKKFYQCMFNLGYGEITKLDYDSLCEDIKENLEVWQDMCESYNHGFSSSFGPF